MVPAESVKICRYSDPKQFLSAKLFFTYSKISPQEFVYVRLFFTYSEITAQNKIYVCKHFGRNGNRIQKKERFIRTHLICYEYGPSSFISNLSSCSRFVRGKSLDSPETWNHDTVEQNSKTLPANCLRKQDWRTFLPIWSLLLSGSST